jgi:adenine/guanine phosphoribosyltransferase-like PRPP-binding protein
LHVSAELDGLSELIDINAPAGVRTSVADALSAAKAVVKGHFALHAHRHAVHALRFRGIARDPLALETVVDVLDAQLPGSIASQFPGAKVLSPESAGFFLGNELARRRDAELVICQTDMRRLPTTSLLSGAIQPNDRVVIVNDVAGTGASLDALRNVAAERGALLVGAVLFGVVQPDRFRDECERLDLPYHWLVTGKWTTHAPRVDCPGCMANLPLMPIAELA